MHHAAPRNGFLTCTAWLLAAILLVMPVMTAFAVTHDTMSHACESSHAHGPTSQHVQIKAAENACALLSVHALAHSVLCGFLQWADAPPIDFQFGKWPVAAPGEQVSAAPVLALHERLFRPPIKR